MALLGRRHWDFEGLRTMNSARTLLAILGVVALCVIVVGTAIQPPAAAPPRTAPAAVPSPQEGTSIYGWSSLGPTPGGNLSGGVYLFIPLNSTGVLTYSTWHVDMASSVSAPYSIYLGGLEIASGNVLGAKTVSFNGSGSQATMLVGFSGTTYHFTDEIVASVPVSQYYGSTPSPLLYTAQEFEQALTTAQAQEYAVVILAFIGSFFMARKIVIINAKAHASRVL